MTEKYNVPAEYGETWLKDQLNISIKYAESNLDDYKKKVKWSDDGKIISKKIVMAAIDNVKEWYSRLSECVGGKIKLYEIKIKNLEGTLN